MRTSRITSALAATGVALTLAAGPAAAAPTSFLDTLFGSLSGPEVGPSQPGPSNPGPSNPGPSNPETPSKPSTPTMPGASNGVATLSLTVSVWTGRKLGPDLYATGFEPRVKWSARDRANAEVKGDDCQIEVQFPGTSAPTYKSAECQGWRNFSSPRYKEAGRYSIVVIDRVSGAKSTSSFTIE
ncbi:hypothetical protein [Gordonia rhizosphera]|uniref:Uncharacterized protein n=1 Tax=Gordonia rhizosphera NBRC 16068 TaxID=1108045 RepID=K6VW70_9ACTN|nr:hypothetical protein [Gordonia rhizosphera]GAB91155.1 hypothetical protein GORHZ_125_00380 [Gordonia rhizosphera NBRC 16068]